MLAARSAFLHYGFRRVSMNDIAEAAGVSRATLYLAFRSKEDIFLGVFRQWVDGTLSEIERRMAACPTAREKLTAAFELWAVGPFELMSGSPEARELLECSFDFAQAALEEAYAKFEATIAPALASLALRPPGDPARTAHILAASVRGFKQTASNPAELRGLIADLLALTLR